MRTLEVPKQAIWIALLFIAGSCDRDKAGESCPAASKARDAGKLGYPELSEASGLSESRRHPGLLWLHNDSGDSARLFAVATNGKARGILTVDDADNDDWEDVAIGPGPKAGKSYLFVADTGNNDKKRDTVQIYRFGEPDLTLEGELVDAIADADRITVRYPDGRHDVEALLVDPLSGDIYLVEKTEGNSGVYRIAAPRGGSSVANAVRVASVDLALITGGDVLPDGTGVALRTNSEIGYWPRDPSDPLESAFAQPPCMLELSSESQGEALGFFANGKGYFTVSEGAGAMLHAYDLNK